jgi:hypothetical protein
VIGSQEIANHNVTGQIALLDQMEQVLTILHQVEEGEDGNEQGNSKVR